MVRPVLILKNYKKISLKKNNINFNKKISGYQINYLCVLSSNIHCQSFKQPT